MIIDLASFYLALTVLSIGQDTSEDMATSNSK